MNAQKDLIPGQPSSYHLTSWIANRHQFRFSTDRSQYDQEKLYALAEAILAEGGNATRVLVTANGTCEYGTVFAPIARHEALAHACVLATEIAKERGIRHESIYIVVVDPEIESRQDDLLNDLTAAPATDETPAATDEQPATAPAPQTDEQPATAPAPAPAPQTDEPPATAPQTAAVPSPTPTPSLAPAAAPAPSYRSLQRTLRLARDAGLTAIRLTASAAALLAEWERIGSPALA